MLYKATYFSPVGKITLASDGDNIIGLWLEGQKYYGGTLTENASRGRIFLFSYPLKLGWINTLRVKDL